MKAISLWQFWASAVALGLKRYETRHWSTNYRGPLAIHAARKQSGEIKRLFDNLMCSASFRHPIEAAGIFSYTMLPFGGIVAVAELAEVIPTETILERGLGSPLERNLGDYSKGRFAWRLENIRPLKRPHFMAGRQGFFEVPEPTEDLFREIELGEGFC